MIRAGPRRSAGSYVISHTFSHGYHRFASASPKKAPQDYDFTEHRPATDVGDDDGSELIALVRALDRRARAADDRSAQLEERLALLEGGGGADAAAGANAANANGEQQPLPAWGRGRGRFGRHKTVSFEQDQQLGESTRDVFSQNEQQGDAEEGALTPAVSFSTNDNNGGPRTTVVGVPEDDRNDDRGALLERILHVERRLDDGRAEEKSASVAFDDERRYGLPESTFTFLITHGPMSVPFAFAVFSMTLSIGCLGLTLASSVQKGTSGNRLGIPAGVDVSVKAAQFLGAIVGVLMEDEIPQGLQLIANGAGHTLLMNGRTPVHMRVVISSVFRLVVGYLFLSSLFINIAQNSDVISIFYDVLALEFVENIDDTTFALAKKGFFGRSLLVAANGKYNLEIADDGMHRYTMDRRAAMGASTASMTERRLSFSGLIASNNRVNSIVRFVYFLNAAIVLGGLGYITSTQSRGHYRCNTISVVFDEEVWENANAKLPDVGTDERLLIYSSFTGTYKQQGSFEGYPMYVEQNKNDGSEFGPSVTGAEMKYCHEIGSWVFMHPNIIVNNECSWLWRSSPTEDYDILSTTYGSWEAWTGKVKLSQVSIACNECSEDPDCNYHGSCKDKMCHCDPDHFGDSCEFKMPCESLVSEKSQSLDLAAGDLWEQENPIKLWGSNQTSLYKVYNRPVYIQKALSGEPFDMRLYSIREKSKSSLPSTQPSLVPSMSSNPTSSPSPPPTTQIPTSSPVRSRPLFGAKEEPEPPTFPSSYGQEYADDDYYQEWPDSGWMSDYGQEWPTSSPAKPLHSQKEYDTAPDFADWDDFFESPTLHDLEDILEDYSVVIFYSGSRFYGTIIEADATIDDLFPSDYHSFWSQSFNKNRTFIISDKTFDGSPVGIDFFEMRRRVNTMRNQDVHFSYGPFGALIPLMDYEDTGFFHCFDGTPQPSTSPSLLWV